MIPSWLMTNKGLFFCYLSLDPTWSSFTTDHFSPLSIFGLDLSYQDIFVHWGRDNRLLLAWEKNHCSAKMVRIHYYSEQTQDNYACLSSVVQTIDICVSSEKSSSQGKGSR